MTPTGMNPVKAKQVRAGHVFAHLISQRKVLSAKRKVYNKVSVRLSAYLSSETSGLILTVMFYY
jgi:hypothetical protein